MSILEVTVLSVEGLHHHYSSFPFTALFSTRITPFITLTKINGDKPSHVYTSKAPSWEHTKFRVPLDSTFFSDKYSSLRLQIFSKRRITGPAQLGWCLIPASDIGFLPSGSLRFLSYRLRAKDGSRSHGIVNLSVRLVQSGTPTLVDACQTVIGMPVTAIMSDEGGATSRRKRDSKMPLSDTQMWKLR